MLRTAGRFAFWVAKIAIAPGAYWLLFVTWLDVAPQWLSDVSDYAVLLLFGIVVFPLAAVATTAPWIGVPATRRNAAWLALLIPLAIWMFVPRGIDATNFQIAWFVGCFTVVPGLLALLGATYLVERWRGVALKQ